MNSSVMVVLAVISLASVASAAYILPCYVSSWTIERAARAKFQIFKSERIIP